MLLVLLVVAGCERSSADDVARLKKENAALKAQLRSAPPEPPSLESLLTDFPATRVDKDSVRVVRDGREVLVTGTTTAVENVSSDAQLGGAKMRSCTTTADLRLLRGDEIVGSVVTSGTAVGISAKNACGAAGKQMVKVVSEEVGRVLAPAVSSP